MRMLTECQRAARRRPTSRPDFGSAAARECAETLKTRRASGTALHPPLRARALRGSKQRDCSQDGRNNIDPEQRADRADRHAEKKDAGLSQRWCWLHHFSPQNQLLPDIPGFSRDPQQWDSGPILG